MASASLEVTTETSPTLVDLARRYIELHQRKQEAEAATRAIAQEKDAIEEQLAESLGLEGVDNVKLDGFTVYRKRDTYCAIMPGRKPELIKQLEAMGYGDLITVNSNSLRSRVKEWNEQGCMPEGFGELVALTESFGVAVRKA